MVNYSASLDRSLLALAHRLRRGILERLARGPATVGEATQGFTISKPAISKHLKVLEDAGILVREVQGRTHRLDVDQGPLTEAATWIEHHRSIWERTFDAVERHLSEQP